MKVRTISAKEYRCSTPPKLSLNSLPRHRPESPGMATPPLRLPVSIPFQWEEAPGKPKRELTPRGRRPFVDVAVRRLELPPRLAAAAMAEETKWSPTAVLDGPDFLGHHISLGSCYSFAEGRASLDTRYERKEGVAWFWRRVGSGRKMRSDEPQLEGGGISRSSISSSSSSSSCQNCGDHGIGEEEINIRMKARLRRNRSLASISTLHLWESFYGSLKRVVPWRKRMTTN